MLSRRFGVPAEEAATARAGFWTLLCIVAGHALLETARDTLFLTDLPATALPWAYLAIAGLAWVAASASRSLASRLERRALLAGTLALGSTLTLLLWRVCATPSTGALLALYVWGGLLATSVLVQFWVLLAELVVGQPRATPVLSFVALGGLLGGALGSAIAAGLLIGTDTRSLLLASAGVFGLAALQARRFERAPSAQGARRRYPQRPPRPPRAGPYVRRLVALPFVAATATTGVDFLFKSIVEASVPQAELGTFFSVFYASVNTLALGFQLLVTSPLLRTLGAGPSLVLLPSLCLAAAATAALFGGILPAALLKSADGSLRHSLQRTGVELLFLPMTRSARERARALAAGPGQRGGQALGSLLTLGGISLGLGPSAFAVGVAGLCGLWALAAARAGRLYRERLGRRLEHRRQPERAAER